MSRKSGISRIYFDNVQNLGKGTTLKTINFHSKSAFLNPNYTFTHFFEKKYPWTTNEDFHHLKAFLKASLTLLSTKKKLYNSHFTVSSHDPFEICHDPLLGLDASVEKANLTLPNLYATYNWS
jgi:hypothetical protein